MWNKTTCCDVVWIDLIPSGITKNILHEMICKSCTLVWFLFIWWDVERFNMTWDMLTLKWYNITRCSLIWYYPMGLDLEVWDGNEKTQDKWERVTQHTRAFQPRKLRLRCCPCFHLCPGMGGGSARSQTGLKKSSSLIWFWHYNILQPRRVWKTESLTLW